MRSSYLLALAAVVGAVVLSGCKGEDETDLTGPSKANISKDAPQGGAPASGAAPRPELGSPNDVLKKRPQPSGG